jgi:hypothetical protein
MQVVCNHCHAVSEVDAARFAAPAEGLQCSACGVPLALPAVEIGPDTSWLVLMPHGQAGPYSVVEMAELFDDGSIDWSSLVWRPGLKGWRAARRDAQLITSVSTARGSGAFGDTQRVSMSPRTLWPATDTVVEPLKRALERRPNELFALATARALGPDNEDAFTQVTHRIAASEPTVADAFRSAPSIVVAAKLDAPNPDTQPVLARSSAPASWLPSVQSMALVAIVAFGFGVFAAALWGRLFARREQRAATMVVRPAPKPVAEAVPLRPPESAAVGSAVALDVQSLAAAERPELPPDAELRREVRRISPDVRRCIDDLSRGAEIEIYFAGPDGRVSDLRLRTLGLSPGRVECIRQAVRQMQVSPFQRSSYKFWHRFSYGSSGGVALEQPE